MDRCTSILESFQSSEVKHIRSEIEESSSHEHTIAGRNVMKELA
jgi:hypothetical protein